MKKIMTALLVAAVTTFIFSSCAGTRSSTGCRLVFQSIDEYVPKCFCRTFSFLWLVDRFGFCHASAGCYSADTGIGHQTLVWTIDGYRFCNHLASSPCALPPSGIDDAKRHPFRVGIVFFRATPHLVQPTREQHFYCFDHAVVDHSSVFFAFYCRRFCGILGRQGIVR